MLYERKEHKVDLFPLPAQGLCQEREEWLGEEERQWIWRESAENEREAVESEGRGTSTR